MIVVYAQVPWTRLYSVFDPRSTIPTMSIEYYRGSGCMYNHHHHRDHHHHHRDHHHHYITTMPRRGRGRSKGVGNGMPRRVRSESVTDVNHRSHRYRSGSTTAPRFCHQQRSVSIYKIRRSIEICQAVDLRRRRRRVTASEKRPAIAVAAEPVREPYERYYLLRSRRRFRTYASHDPRDRTAFFARTTNPRASG